MELKFLFILNKKTGYHDVELKAVFCCGISYHSAVNSLGVLTWSILNLISPENYGCPDYNKIKICVNVGRGNACIPRANGFPC